MFYDFSNKVAVLESDKANGFLLAQTQLNDIVYLVLEQNGEVAAHKLPIHVTFFVIDGEGKIEIDGKAFFAKKGDVIEVPENAIRLWNNSSNNKLVLLVVKQKV